MRKGERASLLARHTTGFVGMPMPPSRLGREGAGKRGGQSVRDRARPQQVAGTLLYWTHTLERGVT